MLAITTFTKLKVCRLSRLLMLLTLCGCLGGATSALAAQIVINEVDADTPGSDTQEFIELFGPPRASLDGLVLVLFNGSSDTSYRAIDLDGFALNEEGFFVVGNAGVANTSVVFPNGALQNGADAVALYFGDAADFSTGTPVTNVNLVDALVYDTSDADDSVLLATLTPGQPQINENEIGSKDSASNARVPDGGDPFDSSCYVQQEPTPGAANAPAPAQGWVINEIHADPDPVAGDANGDGLLSATQDEFIELVNNTGVEVDLEGATLADSVRVRHVFGSGMKIPSGCAVVVFGGGLPVGFFGDASITVASTGSLGLNNGGDSITLSLNGVVLVTATYGSAGGLNQSLMLAPEVTGDVYALHSVASGSNGRLFSPGTLANADPFPGCVLPPLTLISSIQGAAHTSPLVGTFSKRVEGIVTELRLSGPIIQAEELGAEPSASRGLQVVLSDSSFLRLGDQIRLEGQILEREDSVSSGLPVTELQATRVRILSRGETLPAPQVLGRGGRMVPRTVISNDAEAGNVLNPGSVFDPEEDALDFFESLEGMRVQVNDALVVGPLSRKNRFVVVPDRGEGSEVFSSRGALIHRSGDPNPERIIVEIADGPSFDVRVGVRFQGGIVGTLDYRDGRYFLRTTEPLPDVIDPALLPESVQPPGQDAELSVAAYNVENLSPLDPVSKFNSIAATVVRNLRSPDILMLSEVQDSSGSTDDGVVDARLTYAMLIDALEAEGGPRYRVAEIEPLNNQDGGRRGGNIRCGFLYNPLRVTLAEAPVGDASQQVEVTVGTDGEIHLSHNPGRISVDEGVFGGSRKPLAAEFRFDGKTVFLVAAHLDAKVLDDPLFGAFQPPRLRSEARRVFQAKTIRDFATGLADQDPEAGVIVLGDLNDFSYSEPLRILESQTLRNLIRLIPVEERYTYIFEGNAQALDHILATPNLADGASLDAVHVNAEYSEGERASDHDPVHATFRWPDPELEVEQEGEKGPVILSGPWARPIRTGFSLLSVEDPRAPLVVEVGQQVTFSVVATSSDGRKLSYDWIFGDGFEGRGAETSHRFGVPGRYTIRVTIADGLGVVEGSLDLRVAARMAVRRMRLKLDFRGTGSDRLDLSGVVVLPKGFAVDGKPVSIDVGGVALSFLLDAKGRARTDLNRFSISRKRKGLWAFQLTAKGVDAREAWRDEGLLNENTRNKLKFMRTSVEIGKHLFSTVRPLTYSARTGQAGVAR